MTMTMAKVMVAGSLVVLTVAGTLGCSTAARTAPLQGCWELQSAQGTSNGQNYSLPGNISGSQFKCYSDGHFLFVGQYTMNGQTQASYGGGTYSLKGDTYTETLTYHVASSSVGKTLTFKLAINGNQITQTGPLDAQGQKSLGGSATEVYIRKD
jgi:hypothetical protein